MLNRISTWLSTRRKVRELVELTAAHDDHLVNALKRISVCENQLVELNAAHLKLRGKLYGEGLHKQPAVPESREARRAAALRSVGFTPGQPVNLGS